MAKRVRQLTDKDCKNAKFTPNPEKGAGNKLFDGGGLFLHLMPTGSKIWRLKYRKPNGREALLTYGPYPHVTLPHARAKREESRHIIREGKDPALEADKAKSQASLLAKNTFEKVARDWFNNYKDGWVPRHAQNILNRLENDIFPVIGHLPITSIDNPTVLEAVRKIEARGARDIAKRITQYCCQIFNYAIGCGISGLKYNPAQGLTRLLKPYEKGHFQRIDIKDIPSFLHTIENNGGRMTDQTLITTKLLMLTLLRTSELIATKWEEVDFEKAELTVASERMKMKGRPPFVVPLSTQALQLLEQQRARTGNYIYVFPHNSKAHACMSNCTVLSGLYRLGYKGKMTGHGFRSLGVDVLSSILKHPKDVVDKCLAHGEKSKVMSAYFRDPYLDQRRVLMQEWADYLDHQRNASLHTKENTDVRLLDAA